MIKFKTIGKRKTKFNFYLLWLVILTAISTLSLPTFGQQMAVSGTVTDKAGEPLPGITVVVKGPTQGTVINADGEYYPALICTKGIRNSFLNNIFVNSWTVKTSSRAYYDYQVFKHNICVNTGPYSEYYVDNRNTITLIEQEDYQADMDYNLVWMGDKPVRSLDKDKYYDWQEWQAEGWDSHSLIADPRLIDDKHPELGVMKESPAFEIGFKQIDMSNTGLITK